jgi:hypothetical protein
MSPGLYREPPSAMLTPVTSPEPPTLVTRICAPVPAITVSRSPTE